jgi:zinc protease
MTIARKLLVLAVLLTAAPLLAAPRADHPSQLKFEPLEFEIPKTTRHVLDNGMVVHLLENHELPLVTVTAWVRAGGKYDPADKAGLAALAGMTMRAGGSEKHPMEAFDEELDRISALLGTSFELEHAECKLDVLARNLDRGLELYAELLTKPAFPDPILMRFKQRLAAAYRMRNDDPGGIADREIGKLLYGDHPYAREATPATIGAITRDDLVAMHANTFRPGNVILGVAGDFESEAMLAKLEKLFGGWKAEKAVLPEVPAVNPEPEHGVHLVEKDVTQSSIRIGHLGVKRNSEERVRADLMNIILGGGSFFSRLNGAVRGRQGLAYSVYSQFTRAEDLGLFQVSTDTKSESTWKAVSIILDEIQKIREEPVTKEELETARGMILNGIVFGFENPADVAEAYVSLEYYGYPADWYDRYLSIVRTITIDEIREVAKRRLDPENITILVVGKASSLDERPASIPEPHTLSVD